MPRKIEMNISSFFSSFFLKKVGWKILRKWLLRCIKVVKNYVKQCGSQVQRQPVRIAIATLITFLMGFWLGSRAGILWFVFVLFLVYEWENRIIGGAALVSLITCPILLSLGKNDWAEEMAIYAYFFLAMTVVLQIVEFKRHPDHFKENETI